jgi:hypothetical protein
MESDRGKLVTMKASVSEGARDVLVDYLAREGVTLGAFIEAYAEAVEVEGGRPVNLTRETLIERARVITAGRRQR